MLIINQGKNIFVFDFNKGSPRPPFTFSDGSELCNQAIKLSKGSKISPEYPSHSGPILHDSHASLEKDDLFYFIFLSESCHPLFKSRDPCTHLLSMYYWGCVGCLPNSHSPFIAESAVILFMPVGRTPREDRVLPSPGLRAWTSIGLS